MIDPRASSILYQSQGYLIDLVDKLITEKRLGKVLNKEWDRADRIVHYLEVYNHRSKLDDPSQINYILNCLIELAELYQFPAAPTVVYQDPPAVIIGIQGPPGPQGPPGNDGATGLATDRQTVISTTSPVDSFDIDAAKGARWDYVVIEQAGNQRTGFVYGTWTPDGQHIDFFDNSTADLIGSTEPITFEVAFDGANIQLIAVITSGIWTVVLTRYFTPNNGNGTGPVSASLQHGLIWIGNSLNQAQQRSVSGDISITDDGTVSYTPLSIVNGDISNGAAIAVTKLEALTGDRVVITNNLGYLTTAISPTVTELGYVGGATSNLQVQINNRLIDPTTNIGDMIIRDANNIVARLPIGSTGQVLTSQGGVPVWADAVGSLKSLVIEIGDWNMDADGGINVVIPNITADRIRAVNGVIRSDVGSLLGEAYYPIGGPFEGTAVYVAIAAWITVGSDTTIAIGRKDGTVFDTNNFDATGYNRGWLTVTYV